MYGPMNVKYLQGFTSQMTGMFIGTAATGSVTHTSLLQADGSQYTVKQNTCETLLTVSI